MQKRTGSHAELFYHFVWSTKHRLPMIDDDIEARLNDILRVKAEELDIKIIETNGTRNHIHVLLKSRTALAPADIAKNLKGASSHYINQAILGKDRIRNLYWQDGYGVISVSPGAVKSVQKYIKNQKEHHAKTELVEEFEIASDFLSGPGVR